MFRPALPTSLAPGLFVLAILVPASGLLVCNDARADVAELGASTREVALGAKCPWPLHSLCVLDKLEHLSLDTMNVSRFPSCLQKHDMSLHTLLLFGNLFTEVPHSLRNFQALTMLSFKANRLTVLASISLPVSLQWLILTSNR